MQNQEFQLGAYMKNSVEKIAKGVIRATLTDPKESAFMARFALSIREAFRKRAKAEENGENIPPFLIASTCNAGDQKRRNIFTVFLCFCPFPGCLPAG